MRPSIAMALAFGAVLMTAACEKPTVKGPPKPIYISVEKGGKITFSDNTPPELKAEIRKATQVNK